MVRNLLIVTGLEYLATAAPKGFNVNNQNMLPFVSGYVSNGIQLV